MEPHRYDKLLRQIAAAQQLNPSDFDSEQAYERLDDYIEAELAGQKAYERWPDVAFFIATDPDFAEIYQSLRRGMASVAGETPPLQPVDLAALRTYLAQQLLLAPEDIVRSAQPKASTTEEQAFLQLILPYWQANLPTRGSLFMSGDDPDTSPITIPDHDEPLQVDVVISHSDAGAAVSGVVMTENSDLTDAQVRLYRFVAEPEPVLLHTSEQPVERFGRFTCVDLPDGRYVLALVIDEQIVGITWLDL
jgi:hypothetical protein